MASLLETYLTVAANTPEEDVLRLLLDLGLAVSGGDEASLLAYDRAANDLVFVMHVGSSPQLIGQRVPVNQGITGLAAATREVQLGAPTFGVQQRAEVAAGPQSVIAAPMLVRDELVGVITTVTFVEGRRFTARDMELYAKLATVAAVVVSQRRQLSQAANLESASSAESRIARTLSRLLQRRPDLASHVEHLIGSLAHIAGVSVE